MDRIFAAAEPQFYVGMYSLAKLTAVSWYGKPLRTKALNIEGGKFVESVRLNLEGIEQIEGGKLLIYQELM